MRTIPLDGWSNKHITALLDWLIDEILMSGGDGDATIVMKRHSLEEIRDVVIEWLKSRNMEHWKVSEILNGKTFTAGHYQECLIVTTDRNDVPTWSQCTVEL